MTKPFDPFEQYVVTEELAEQADDFWQNRAFLHDDLPDLTMFGEVEIKTNVHPPHKTIQ